MIRFISAAILAVALLAAPCWGQTRKPTIIGYCYSSSLSSATGLSAFTGAPCNGVSNSTLQSYAYAAICVYGSAIVWLDNGVSPTATPGSGGEGVSAGSCFPYNGNFAQLQFIQQTSGATVGLWITQ